MFLYYAQQIKCCYTLYFLTLYHWTFQAALRKISANCGTKVIEDLDAMELVEPRLLDSFLIYSSRQESYVWTWTSIPHEMCTSLSELYQNISVKTYLKVDMYVQVNFYIYVYNST